MVTTTAETPVLGAPPSPAAGTAVVALGPPGVWAVRVSRRRVGGGGVKVPVGFWLSSCQSGRSLSAAFATSVLTPEPSLFMTARSNGPLEEVDDSWNTTCVPSGE